MRDIGRADDASNRQRRAELLAARVELLGEDRRRQRRVVEFRCDQVHADGRELGLGPVSNTWSIGAGSASKNRPSRSKSIDAYVDVSAAQRRSLPQVVLARRMAS